MLVLGEAGISFPLLGEEGLMEDVRGSVCILDVRTWMAMGRRAGSLYIALFQLSLRCHDRLS